MRSLFFTILLLFATAALGVVALWQLREGNLNRILGTPPTPVGEKIYPQFQPDAVAAISLSSGDKRAHFIKTATGWEATAPWRDRMDSRAALSIISFASTATVEGLVPREKLDADLAGIDSRGVTVVMKDADGQDLIHFRLGRRTPWLQLPEGENPQPVPTTYLLPLDRGRKSHVYAATGYINPLFKDGFNYLRDHRPFYFNPLNLEKIRIRTAQGELTLGRENPASPWRIVKPLDLPTNPEEVKNLLEGLFELQATKLSDRAEVTIPSNGATLENDQIAITPFGSEEEIVLEILAAENPDARDTQATVSDRPDTLFTLPLKTEPDLISIADLPLTVNDLRDPTLTNLNIASIRGIAIETATTPTILISRQPPAPWLATINGVEQEANEQRLYDLLKAITETRALAFETDAATEDLSPWGLDRPILKLTFLAESNQALAIHFGIDRKGDLFANRKGSATIMRLDNAFLEKIAVNPHEWRHARLWSLSRVDLKTLVVRGADSAPLKLNYDFLGETWKAFQAGGEVTANLDPIRANFLLGILENLQVSSWLSPTDEIAAAALEKPVITFELAESTVDEFGDPTGEKKQVLMLAADPVTRKVFGKIDSEPSYFTLTPEIFLKLNIPLLED